MAENAGARFYEGLRVTADHLRHTQDRLWEAVGDLRLALGRGKIAWGLRAEISGNAVRLHPGVAFSAEGVRLAVDTEANLALPAGDGPFLIRLTPINEDRASLQLGGVPTYVTLRAEASVIEEAGAPDAPEALDIGRVEMLPVEPGATQLEPTALQDPTLFIAAGHHGHTGQFVQDAVGRWYYDGPELPELQVLAAQIAEIDGIVAGFDSRLSPLEELPARLSDLEEDAARQSDLDSLSTQIAELLPLLELLAELQALAGLLDDVQAIQGIVERLVQVEELLNGLRAAVETLEARVSALEERTGSEPVPRSDGGDGFDPDWPHVVGISWPHGEMLRPEDAFEFLTELALGLSMPLDPSSARTAGMAVQVWFEPMDGGDRQVLAQPILTIPGKSEGNGDQIVWSTVVSFDDILNITRRGGRVLIRLHCGALVAEDGRSYSASLQSFVDAKAPPVPGGVLESWFFVQGG